jgi:hypothetical protein
MTMDRIASASLWDVLERVQPAIAADAVNIRASTLSGIAWANAGPGSVNRWRLSSSGPSAGSLSLAT